MQPDKKNSASEQVSSEQTAHVVPELNVVGPESQAGPIATTPLQMSDDTAVLVPPPMPPAAATPVPSVPSSATPVNPEVDALVAHDSDIIEKEWVEQADKIITARANDPAGEEEAEEDLSQTYLKKRFNVDVEDAK